MHRTIRQAWWFANLLMILGAVTLAVAFSTIFGPLLESKFFPVTKDVRMEQVAVAIPDTIAFDVYGTKVRPCVYVETRVLTFRNGTWEKGEATFSTNSKVATRPLGAQYFGTWYVKPQGKQIKFEVVNDCHIFWHTVTDFGVWPK